MVRSRFESLLCQASYLSDLGSLTHSQPNLPHRVVLRLHWRKGEWCSLFWDPVRRKVGYKQSKHINPTCIHMAIWKHVPSTAEAATADSIGMHWNGIDTDLFLCCLLLALPYTPIPSLFPAALEKDCRNENDFTGPPCGLETPPSLSLLSWAVKGLDKEGVAHNSQLSLLFIWKWSLAPVLPCHSDGVSIHTDAPVQPLHRFSLWAGLKYVYFYPA